MANVGLQLTFSTVDGTVHGCVFEIFFHGSENCDLLGSDSNCWNFNKNMCGHTCVLTNANFTSELYLNGSWGILLLCRYCARSRTIDIGISWLWFSKLNFTRLGQLASRGCFLMLHGLWNGTPKSGWMVWRLKFKIWIRWKLSYHVWSSNLIRSWLFGSYSFYLF